MMSQRVQRARQLRLRQKKGRSISDVLHRSSNSIIACILLLLCIGASLSTSYIMIHYPESMGIQKFQIHEYDRNNRPLPRSSLGMKSEMVDPPPKKAKVKPLRLPPSYIPSCSVDEMTKLRKHLPPEGCFQPSWKQECSFTLATIKDGCPDTTTYFRQPLASMSLQETFTSVIAGIRDQDDVIMDLLQLVTHNTRKYDVEKWRHAVGIPNGHCPPKPVTFSGIPQKARTFVLEPDIEKAIQAKKWKTKVNLNDSELHGETTRLTATPDSKVTSTFTKWASIVIPRGQIHFMRIGSGNDYDILLSGAAGALNRVWYLEFEYDRDGAWKSQSLEVLIDDILRDFACYWQGANGNLWRISGCWQDHYDKHSHAYIACVNVVIDGVKPIYEKMEQVFQYTLTKDLEFVAR